LHNSRLAGRLEPGGSSGRIETPPSAADRAGRGEYRRSPTDGGAVRWTTTQPKDIVAILEIEDEHHRKGKGMSQRIPAEVFPPGEFIRDELEARGWTETDLAEILDLPLKAVGEILTGKRAITPETAAGLGEAFGVDARFWMDLESAYRLSKVRDDRACERPSAS
jgi:addiction module HigA family antidote